MSFNSLKLQYQRQPCETLLNFLQIQLLFHSFELSKLLQWFGTKLKSLNYVHKQLKIRTNHLVSKTECQLHHSVILEQQLLTHTELYRPNRCPITLSPYTEHHLPVLASSVQLEGLWTLQFFFFIIFFLGGGGGRRFANKYCGFRFTWLAFVTVQIDKEYKAKFTALPEQFSCYFSGLDQLSG